MLTMILAILIALVIWSIAKQWIIRLVVLLAMLATMVILGGLVLVVVNWIKYAG